MVGAHLADLLLQAFGLVSLLLPLACFLFAWRLFKFRDVKVRFYKGTALLILMLSLCGLISLRVSKITFFGQSINEAGGAVGRILTSYNFV